MNSQYTRIRNTNAANVNIRQHRRVVSPDMNSQCIKESIIHVKSVVIKQLQRVISLHTGSPFKYNCNSCDYKATWKDSITKHKKSVHEGKKYQCKDCSSLFTQKSSLPTHQQFVHMVKKYPCKICSYQASQKGHLKKHKNTVHKCKVVSTE